MHDAAPGPNLNKAVEPHGKTLTLEEDSSNTLRMGLVLKGPLREADCSWFEEQKVLFLQMTSGEDGKSRGAPKEAFLKGLRFGPQDDLTRMVADLDALETESAARLPKRRAKASSNCWTGGAIEESQFWSSASST